ncbi:MAG: hypothetical protein V8T45_10840 [Oscillospiraceae bacterium]
MYLRLRPPLGGARSTRVCSRSWVFLAEDSSRFLRRWASSATTFSGTPAMEATRMA